VPSRSLVSLLPAPGILYSVVFKTAPSHHMQTCAVCIYVIYCSTYRVALFTAGDGAVVTLWCVHRNVNVMCSITVFTRVVPRASTLKTWAGMATQLQYSEAWRLHLPLLYALYRYFTCMHHASSCAYYIMWTGLGFVDLDLEPPPPPRFTCTYTVQQGEHSIKYKILYCTLNNVPAPTA
jgi:hypothetical protein